MLSLPVVPSSRPIRSSKRSRWRAAVLLAVHVAIAAHIAHWLVVGRTITPVEPSEAMALGRDGVLNAGLIFFAATILLTAIFGRFFCGWACHLLALQDSCLWLLKKLGIRPVPLRSRLLRWVPAIAFVYMFLWPAAYRLLTNQRWQHLETEWTTTEFWATFPGWIIALLTFLICGFATVYFLGSKGFCTYACPYGAAFAAADRLAPLRIRVTDDCEGCGHCTAVCTSNVRVHQEVRDWGMVVDSGCMKCQDCVSVCPKDALYYGRGPIPLLATPEVPNPEPRRYPLRAWEEALLAAAFVAAFLTFRGLYGAVPFLMALGVAAVLAGLTWLAARMVVRSNVTFRGIALRRSDRLTRGGWVCTALFVGIVGFWFHSAVVRYHAFTGGRAYAQTADIRRAVAAGEGEVILTESDRKRVAIAKFHLDRVEDWGLFRTSGIARRMAWLHLLSGSSEEMERAGQAALGRGEAPAEMAMLLARQARSRATQDRAALASTRLYYDMWIREAPRNPQPYLELGRVLAEVGALADTRVVLRQGLGQNPSAPALLYNLGIVQAMDGEAEEAIRSFEQTLAVDPQHREARENLAGVLAGRGRFEESFQWFRAALAAYPDDAEMHLLFARALLKAGRAEEAKAHGSEALRLAPGWPAAQQFVATPPRNEARRSELPWPEPP